MELHKLLALLNGFALAANCIVFIFGAIVLRDARKLNKELKEYANEYKKRHNL